ncbi:MAG TPA: glycosyltransferase family 39 protein, partial [Verrucomicrobiaceae bacterium]
MPGETFHQRAWGDTGARRWMVAAWVFWILALATGMAAVFMTREGWHVALIRDKPRPEDFARWGTVWAAAVNGSVCAMCAIIAVWQLIAARKRSVHREEMVAAPMVPAFSQKAIVRSEWIWLMILLALAGMLRWPRMGLSFYNDEAHTFRTYIAGRSKVTDDGSVTWRPVRWGETLWLNKVGNNQAPCSIFGRLFYDGWRKISGAAEGTVCETAVRLPQFIAGMASLIVLWLAARRMAGPHLARWVLLLAALHPWHVRYSTEARAYGFLLLGVAWCFYALQRALEDGRWRWWLSLGLGEFLCLWSFPGAIYFVFVFDALVLAVLAGRVKRDGWNPVWGFGLGVLIGAMLTLQLMLPAAPQIAEAMRQLESLKGEMGFDWWLDAFSGIFFGNRGVDRDPSNPDNLALLRETMQWPWSWT